MKLEDGFTKRTLEGGDQGALSAEVFSGGRKQCLVIEGGVLVLLDEGARIRSWPLHSVRFKTDLPDGSVMLEAGGENLSWSCEEEARAALAQLAAAATGVGASPEVVGGAASDAALAALLDDAEPEDADAERRVRRLGERLARLDALNVAGMLAAATDGGGAQLAASLEAGVAAGAGVSARLARLEAVVRAAPAALAARSGAARADAAARALLAELTQVYAWLDAPALRQLDDLHEVSLATTEGRARALAAAAALRTALRGPGAGAVAGEGAASWERLGAVRARLRRLERARGTLAASLARSLNNTLIRLAAEQRAPPAHHDALRAYAPFMHWLKDMDEKAYEGLLKVYVSTWARVYERAVAAACETARAALAVAPAEVAAALDPLLDLVESACNAEQDFCVDFFHLDSEVKNEVGEVSENEGEAGEGFAGAGAAARRVGGEARRLRVELFPALETELLALLTHIERLDSYGAMRALACVGRRVLGEGGEVTGAAAAGGERWARSVLAGVAVACKRGADRAVADRLAALADAVKQAARRPQCGILAFIPELEAMSAECERIFAGGRRADLDRWYLSLATAMLRAVAAAEHPRTPRSVVQLENYHRLHACVSALRVPALEPLRREARARYAEALRAYVAATGGRPLEKLAAFFEGVAEAVAGGAREDEVCYRAAFSKHELRRVLAQYPAAEVRRSLHRLYARVERQLSAEGGLLQVVWRALQQEFVAAHVALAARIQACYPGAGLQLPLSTQDILEAFSDIAREH